jgi:MaoC like domain
LSSGTASPSSATSPVPARAPAPVTAAVGDRLCSFERVTDMGTWNRYAAVNDEFVSIHMDDEAGRAAGYEGAIGMGNLQWAYVHNLLRAWIGEDGRIRSVSFELRGPNVKGQRLIAGGEVVERTERDGEVMLSVKVWTSSGAGDQLGCGTAVVSLPSPPAHPG